MKSSRKLITKSIITTMLTLGMMFTLAVLMPRSGLKAKADGDPVEYIDRSWDDENKAVVETTKTCSSYTIVTDQTDWNNTAPNSGWYVVKNGASIENNRIIVTGTVNLILCDGKKLTAKKGITVNKGNILNIFCQSAGTGILYAGTVYGNDATADNNYAGIGSANDNDCGTITINGGIVTATGGTQGAGIGGGILGAGGTITINGGSVTATGGLNGAGIGGGYGGAGGNITINGGSVTATGGTQGAGIGGGFNGGDGGSITINGGSVTATGGGGGAGIGGGESDAGETGAGGNITISGGTVTATGGLNGAGIGGGRGGAGGTVTITGGSVTATGGSSATGIGEGAGTSFTNHGNLKIGTGVVAYADRSALSGNETWEKALSTESPDNENLRRVTGNRQIYMKVMIPNITGVSFSKPSLTIGESDAASLLTATVSSDKDADKAVRWTVTYDGDKRPIDLFTDENCSVSVDDSLTDKLSVYVKPVALGNATITATAINGDSASCTVTVKKRYTATVTDGEGSGDYLDGETVTITANAAPEGKLFDKWTTDDGVTFADASASSTTFVMPAKPVTVTANYKDMETVATPVFSPEEGTFTAAQSVTITCATEGAEIHYTTDGTAPTKDSTKYTAAIAVADTTTIKAIAIKTGMKDSAVAEAIYTIKAESSEPTDNPDPVTTYTVTVTGGTGGGSFAAGATVTITAGAAPAGKEFDKWTTSDGVTFADANAASTTFTMPAKAVTVTATYRDIPDPLITPAPAAPVKEEATINEKPVKIEAEFTYPQAVTWTGKKITKEQLGVLADDGQAVKVTITGLADAIANMKPNTDPTKFYSIVYDITGKEVGSGNFKIKIKLNNKALKKAKIKGDDKKALEELVNKLNDDLAKDHSFKVAPIDLSNANESVKVTIKATLKKKKVQVNEEDGTIKGLKSVTITYKVPAGKNKNGKPKYKTQKYTYNKNKVNGKFVINVTDRVTKKVSITATADNQTFSGTRTDVSVKK